LPFVAAVVKHHLIPSRDSFLKTIKVAVDCDEAVAMKGHQGSYGTDFGFLTDLYSLKHTPFQELIPDSSRYGIICLLPPGATSLSQGTRVVPQQEMLTPGRPRAIFDAAYPNRFAGDAFMWECDGTVIITDSNENLDINQPFHMSLNAGPVREIAGIVGLQQYLIGKVAKDGRSFWFQTNAESPDRDMVLSLSCPRKPQWQVAPASATIQSSWDEAGHTLRLRLSVRQGAVEVTVS
jgi:hypothetical protein